jgi:hypothetical protein
MHGVNNRNCGIRLLWEIRTKLLCSWQTYFMHQQYGIQIPQTQEMEQTAKYILVCKQGLMLLI